METFLTLIEGAKGTNIAEFTNHTITFVIWLNFGLISLTILVLLIVIYYRLRSILREHRRNAFAAVWQPLLEHCIYELPDSLPPLPTRDLINFLLLWNMMQENLRGEVRENLNFMARWLNIDSRIKNKMKTANLYEQLLYINTVGLMRSIVLWDLLEDTLLENKQQILALAAAKALVRINDKRAAGVIIPLVAVRTEWPLSAVASIISQIRPAYVTETLQDVIVRMPEPMILRMTRYLQFATKEAAIAMAIDIIGKYDNDNLTAACINVLGELDHGEHLELVRSFAHHNNWVIRLQAVMALGKLGTADDVPLLVDMLSDHEWWIRHRAAQSLATLPFIDHTFLEDTIAQLTDKYAIEALQQAVVEKMAIEKAIAG